MQGRFGEGTATVDGWSRACRGKLRMGTACESSNKLDWKIEVVEYGESGCSGWVWIKRLIQRFGLLRARASLCPRLEGEQNVWIPLFLSFYVSVTFVLSTCIYLSTQYLWLLSLSLTIKSFPRSGSFWFLNSMLFYTCVCLLLFGISLFDFFFKVHSSLSLPT